MVSAFSATQHIHENPPQNGIQVYMRKDSTIDMQAPNIFIKIGTSEYTINSVGDTDLDGLEIEITAST